MVKISILIPVYNAQDFLYDSIPCLLNQTFEDIELICVNDGSRDDSLNILNEFSKKDPRVKVIDKENGGCGSARNRALNEANGDYVYFFDPDDMIEKDALELSYNAAIKNNSDIVVFKANIFDKKGISNRETFFYYDKSLKREQFNNFSRNEIKEYVLKGGYAPWSKLYKKEFLDSYDDFKFDLNIAFDDVPFHVKSMLRAKRMSFINKFLYHYRVDNVNSVNSTNSNGFDIFRIIDIVENILKKENCFSDFSKEFYTFKVGHILLYIISTDSSKYFNMARERFKNINRDYIKYNYYLKVRYDLVLDCESFDEFKYKYNILNLKTEVKEYEEMLKKLRKENNKLKKENSKLKKINNNILNSKSWKLTKPLRKIRN